VEGLLEVEHFGIWIIRTPLPKCFFPRYFIHFAWSFNQHGASVTIKLLWSHLDTKLNKPSLKFIVYWTLACKCNWIRLLTFWTYVSPSSIARHYTLVSSELCGIGTVSWALSSLLWRRRGGQWSAKVARTYVSSWREEPGCCKSPEVLLSAVFVVCRTATAMYSSSVPTRIVDVALL
jgi:hypothetical protein